MNPILNAGLELLQNLISPYEIVVFSICSIVRHLVK